jgi:hypothetical protein
MDAIIANRFIFTEIVRLNVVNFPQKYNKIRFRSYPKKVYFCIFNFHHEKSTYPIHNHPLPIGWPFVQEEQPNQPRFQLEVGFFG